jgi:hypothetical protein
VQCNAWALVDLVAVLVEAWEVHALPLDAPAEAPALHQLMSLEVASSLAQLIRALVLRVVQVRLCALLSA